MREKLHELPWYERAMLSALTNDNKGLLASLPRHLSAWAEYYMSQFYISDCAGRGANGEVWRGITTGESSPPVHVVLKRIYGRKGAGVVASSMREIFFGELLGAKRVNLSRFLTHFVENGELWLVFRDEGVSLYQAIFEPVRVGNSMIMTQSLFWRDLREKPHLLLSIMKQIFQGLAELHSLKITHRDIKLENIFIDPTSLHVRIGDFGSAIHFPSREGTASHFPPNGPSVDEETQRYAPPEEWRIERSPALDIWCVGIMWLEIFLGSVDLGLEDRREGICVRDETCSVELLRSRIIRRDPLGKGIEDEDMLNLLSQLLSYDPDLRPSAEKALEHAVFSKSQYPPGRSSAVEIWRKPASQRIVVNADTALSQGGRSSMEDRLATGWLGGASENFLACVMDGHNGDAMSNLLRDAVAEFLREYSEDENVPETILRDLMERVLEIAGAHELEIDPLTGSTLCCALVSSDGVWVANIGDSRLIITEPLASEREWKPELGARVITPAGVSGKIKQFRNNIALVEPDGGSGRLTAARSVRPAGPPLKAVQITVDHKPDNLVEKEFIEANGGSVTLTGSTARVDGILAISRSVGVRALRPAVRNEPDFFSYSFNELPFRKLVLATDGVWDVLSVQEVAELGTAQSIVDQAIAGGARDNIAVVVLEIGS